MAVIRINAAEDGGLTLPGGDPGWTAPLDRALRSVPPRAPIVFVIHGYRYAPNSDGTSGFCPHGLLYRSDDVHLCPRVKRPPLAAWPRALGFSEDGNDGICIAFGWQGRVDRRSQWLKEGPGDFATVYHRARAAGEGLARILAFIARRHSPKRIGIMAHSLGGRVVMQAMEARPDALPGRILLLGPAEFSGEARRLLGEQDRLGRRMADLPEILCVGSRANDLYDWLFELFAPAPQLRGDRPLGARGLGMPHLRWMDIQLDHPRVAEWLAAQGLHLTRLPERVTHWSFYSDPGAMAFWSRVLRDEPGWSLAALRARRLPEVWDPRWSRVPQLLPRPRLPFFGSGESGGLTQS